MEKVVIIGSGMAGLTAAIYAARAKLAPTVISGDQPGGQITLTTLVENYPGFPEGIMGPDLFDEMKKQALKFGAVFMEKNATSFKKDGNNYVIGLGNSKITTKSVIIASGSYAKFLGLESEKKFIGRGVSPCATCDGAFFREKEVIVVGGGDTACEDAIFLTKFAKKVIIVHRRDQLKASKIMQERVFKNKKIELIWDSVLEEIIGDSTVTGAVLRNVKYNRITKLKVNGIFIAIGHVPNAEIFKGVIALDEKGYIITDRATKTNLDGVFACGDVQDPIFKQAITAAGSGCQAAIQAEKYLEGLEDG